MNPVFGARLIFNEGWMTRWAMHTFADLVGDDIKLFGDLCRLAANEFFDPRDSTCTGMVDISMDTARYLCKRGYLNGTVPKSTSSGKVHIEYSLSQEKQADLESFLNLHGNSPNVLVNAMSYFGDGCNLMFDVKTLIT